MYVAQCSTSCACFRLSFPPHKTLTNPISFVLKLSPFIPQSVRRTVHGNIAKANCQLQDHAPIDTCFHCPFDAVRDCLPRGSMARLWRKIHLYHVSCISLFDQFLPHVSDNCAKFGGIGRADLFSAGIQIMINVGEKPSMDRIGSPSVIADKLYIVIISVLLKSDNNNQRTGLS